MHYITLLLVPSYNTPMPVLIEFILVFILFILPHIFHLMSGISVLDMNCLKWSLDKGAGHGHIRKVNGLLE